MRKLFIFIDFWIKNIFLIWWIKTSCSLWEGNHFLTIGASFYLPFEGVLCSWDYYVLVLTPTTGASSQI